MALVRCPRHGEQIASFVSASVAAAATSSDGIQPETAVVTLNAGNEMESRHEVDLPTIDRLRGVGLLPHDSLTVSSDAESFEVFCELAPVCCACLNEWCAAKALPA